MSNSSVTIKNAADFTRAQSEGLGFHLNSKNEVKTHGKFTAALYRIRDLFRSRNTINAEKTKLSEALQKILSAHNGMTADPGADPHLSPAELDNLKHNIKLAADSAVNLNKPGVDGDKLEKAIYARLGSALSSKELNIIKKEILRYGSSQLDAMCSLEHKLQKQAADKNGAYLMSSRQIEDYEGLVDSYLAGVASGAETSKIKMLSSLSKFNVIDNVLLNHPGCEFSREQKLAMLADVDRLAADKVAEQNRTDPQHAKKYLSDEEYNELCADYLNSVIKNKRQASETGISSDSPLKGVIPTDERKRQSVIAAEIVRIAQLYNLAVPKNLDLAIRDIEEFCTADTTSDELAMIIDNSITSGELFKSASLGENRGIALREKELPDSRVPVRGGNPITQGQVFGQQPGSNTCFMLSIFNGMCNSAQGTRWLNEHVTQDLVQSGTLHFHPRNEQNQESDIEINVHSPEVRQVRDQVLRITGSDCMSDFEAACARAYMDYLKQGYDRVYKDHMVRVFGPSVEIDTGKEPEYSPGRYGEAMVMANILGLHADAQSAVSASDLNGNRQSIITAAQDFLTKQKGIILFHKGVHFTAVQDVRNNGDFVEIDSLSPSATKTLSYDELAARSINLIFISFTQEDKFNVENLELQ